MIRKAAADVIASLRDGPLCESPLRLTVAVGDDARVHLRETDRRVTLCGRKATEMLEDMETEEARGKKPCSGCAKRAKGNGPLAARRAAQIAVRNVHGGKR